MDRPPFRSSLHGNFVFLNLCLDYSEKGRMIDILLSLSQREYYYFSMEKVPHFGWFGLRLGFGCYKVLNFGRGWRLGIELGERRGGGGLGG